MAVTLRLRPWHTRELPAGVRQRVRSAQHRATRRLRQLSSLPPHMRHNSLPHPVVSFGHARTLRTQPPKRHCQYPRLVAMQFQLRRPFFPSRRYPRIEDLHPHSSAGPYSFPENSAFRPGAKCISTYPAVYFHPHIGYRQGSVSAV